MALRRIVAMALAGAFLLALPGAASAATPISVVVFTGMNCISGSGPANREVTATLRTRGGHVRGRFRTVSDSSGEWGGCFPGSVNGTDRLRVVIGGQDRTVRIPRLEPEIDRVNDTITGWAKADDVVFAEIQHFTNFRDSTDHTLAVQADGDGRYKFDTTGTFNLRGGDAVIVFAPHGDDTFGAFVIAPHVNVLHANNTVSGTANNGTDLRFVLTNREGNVKADVTAGTSTSIFGISAFVVDMYKDNGAAAYPVDTDRLASNFASDALLRMPRSSLRGNPANDVVTGECMNNAPFLLEVENEVFYGRTNSTGHFTRDVTNRMNLRRGDQLFLTCMYPTGDTWARSDIAL